MTEKRYRTIFKGEVLRGHDVAEVKRRLAAVFRADVSKIEGLFTGKPVLVSTEVDHDTALRQRAAFEQAGAVLSVEPVPQPPGATSAAARKEVSPGAATAALRDVSEARVTLSHEPPLLTPAIGKSSIFYSPMQCPLLSASEGGIDLNRGDVRDVYFESIRLVSVFSVREEDKVRHKVMIFLKGHRRPFIIDSESVRFTDFPGLTRGNALDSLRCLVALLCNGNQGILLDRATLDFARGEQPAFQDRGEVAVSTAFGHALSPEHADEAPPQKGAPTQEEASPQEEGPPQEEAPAKVVAAAASPAGPAPGKPPGQRTAARGRRFGRKALLLAAVAAMALVSAAAVYVFLAYFRGPVEPDYDQVAEDELRAACLMAMKYTIKNPDVVMTVQILGQIGYTPPQGLSLSVLDGRWDSLSMSAVHEKVSVTFIADKSCYVTEKTSP